MQKTSIAPQPGNLHEALAAFHPAIQGWFAERFASPTAAQTRGWPTIQEGQNTLIAAPTGSGKTLAAFLACLDDLVRQGIAGELADTTQVLYVSPLKALSNDVQKNLAQPLEEIGEVLRQMGLDCPEIRVSVRTGDTSSTQRQAMVKKPPHILVTTPESFYILLTSEGGRRMLKPVKTVIVDEIHAVAGSKRGAHLALSLERLAALTEERPVRIGLSATQKPIQEVARLLVGGDGAGPDCAIVDEGHRRELDLTLELPSRPLEAVCSNEAWEEIYDRLAELVLQERTTLIFVNTRRLAERATFHLAKRLGEDHVAAHHGSLSREQRLNAEQRLKTGSLKALVATASLELGIDIGTVDLVCQLGSPRSIASLLQRVGRSGHTMGAVSRGRLFPLSRDELVECAALLHQVRQGNLDRLTVCTKPLDILAQQMVAAVAMEEWDEEALFQLYRGAYPYHELTREEFDAVSRMLTEGYATRWGRGGAYLHYDSVQKRFRARKGARLAAVTSGGAIPENADYQVLQEPEGLFLGTVHEDFAVESIPGDIFQLGATSWRILRVEQGKVRVEDAHGMPPTIPFWLGEAPARTDEVSAAVSTVRHEIDQRLPDMDGALAWVREAAGLEGTAAQQLVEYLALAKAALGVVPTQETLVLERFFDESGGMQLVMHSPFGARVNRAWGLALRKRFCRTFNMELQAAVNEDAIVLSLGPQHSFPLEEVFSYLHPNSAQDVLIQALLAAPMFQTRWRWNASRALAILRQSGGRKVPMPLQRMRSDDLLTAVFPDVVACQENIVGDIQLPDHPLVSETLRDCLYEAMDVEKFLSLLESVVGEKVTLVVRDTTAPSPFTHEVLSVRPYGYLDDAPLEERRTQAVSMRRTLDYQTAEDLGRLDAEAIQRVKGEAWPEPENADELHDALLTANYLTAAEGAPWQAYFEELVTQRRATVLQSTNSEPLWVALERLPLVTLLLPGAVASPLLETLPVPTDMPQEPETALRDVLRGRLEILGPVTAESLAEPLGLETSEAVSALTALELQGLALRGRFTPDQDAMEWCDRRLLARIHRHTLDRLRQEIEPVSAADFLRFLAVWQHVDPQHKLDGPTGLVGVLEQLEGFEVPVGAWESHILPERLKRFSRTWLEELCLSGQLAWARLHPRSDVSTPAGGATRSTPIAFLFRDNLSTYLDTTDGAGPMPVLSGVAQDLLECLQNRGACFFQDLVRATHQLPADVEEGMKELVARGYVTCDGLSGLLSLTSPVRKASARPQRRNGPSRIPPSMPNPRQPAGRWSLLPKDDVSEMTADEVNEFYARKLLRRYGVVFPRLLMRENGLPPWRDLVRVYRRLEARGEIRGGRFVAGFSGEQYAQPEAVQMLRSVRRAKPSGAPITVNATDPLNLVGIITPGQRVPSLPWNSVTYKDGVPVSMAVRGRSAAIAIA